MSRVLEGETFNHDDPVMVMWREYRIARLTGWTLEQIDATPGGWIDWALKMADLEGQRRA